VSTISLKAVADELEQFIRETFHVTADDDLFTRQVHLYQEGYVDSAGVVETIAHLELTWDINIPPTAVFDPRFTHIDGMAQYVVSLTDTQHRSCNA
jgi:acyl carrier protein